MTSRLSRWLTSPSRPLALLVLLICLLASVWGWQEARDLVRRDAAGGFDFRASEVVNAIQQRMQAYEQVLRGAVAFIYGSERVTRAEWRVYVRQLALEANYPGIQGIGYAAYVRQGELDALERQVHESHPDFRVWPFGDREVYAPILYLEPFDWRNQRAFGYDMFMERTRRAAMTNARDQGVPTVSGKVLLVQETAEDRQAGFLMYLPVYRGGGVPASLDERRQRILGFVYSPFRMGDLMRGILRRDVPDVAIRIYDGVSPDDGQLMYSSGFDGGRQAFQTVRTVDINGRPWTVRLASRPVLEQAVLARNRPLLVLAGGLLLSLLLFALLWTMAGTEARALAMARAMTDAFRRSEAKFASLVQAAQDAIIITDSEGRIVSWNRGATDMFGYREDSVLGRPWTMIMPARLRREYDRRRQVAAAGGERLLNRVLELSAVREGGEEFPVEVSLTRWGIEGDTFLSAIIRDISERKRVEQALRNSEARFRAIFENAAIGIALSDLDGRVLEANPALERMLGYSMVELCGLDQAALVHPEDLAGTVQVIHDLSSGRRPFVKQHKRYLRKDGSIMWGSLTASLIRDETGQPQLLLRMIEDVTELRAAEEALNRAYHELEQRVEARTRELREQTEELARSNAELEQFAYVASHDLQEPLRSVSGFAQLLERRYKDRLGEDGLSFVRFIVSGTDRMRGLITDLLAYSRVGARQKALVPVDTEAVLAAALHGLSAFIGERGAEIVHDPLPVVRGDAGDLELLFQNLIGNAMKFNRSSPPRVEIRTEDAGKEWLFSVRDNGIGIDPSFFPRIFTIFQRGHRQDEYAGSGVGLAICKKVVERHQGRIWAESEPGRGTTFFFTLPKASEPS